MVPNPTANWATPSGYVTLPNLYSKKERKPEVFLAILATLFLIVIIANAVEIPYFAACERIYEPHACGGAMLR